MALSRRSLFKRGGKLGLVAGLAAALGKAEKSEAAKEATVKPPEDLDAMYQVRLVQSTFPALWVSMSLDAGGYIVPLDADRLEIVRPSRKKVQQVKAGVGE